MDPRGNNDFRALFRWKEVAVSLNLTVKESKQGELFIHEMDTTEGKKLSSPFRDETLFE